MRIPFIGGAYAGRNPAIDTQSMINFYVETDPLDNRSPKYAVPTPGMTLIGNIANAQGRALHLYAGSLYAIVGNTVYQITGTNPLTTITIGTIATSTGNVQVIDNGANNGQQMLALDTSGNGYVISATGSNNITAASWAIDSGVTPFTVTSAQDSFSLNSGHYGSMLFTTSGATSITAGTIVSITGMLPANYNGQWGVSSIQDSTDFFAGFTKVGIANSTQGGTGTIVSGTLSFSTTSTPSFSAGAVVVVSGVNPSTYNGTYTVTGVSAGGFTVAHVLPNPGTYVSGGSVSGATGITQLTNGTNGWPFNGAGTVTYQDSFGIVSELNTGEIFWSANFNFLSWPGLNFATAEAFPDNLVATMSDGTKLFLFSQTHTEVWYDAGTANSAFVRIPGAVYTKGCVASRSPNIIDNSIVYLGNSLLGQPQLYQIRGVSPPIRLSTPQIEYQFNQYLTVSDAISFVQRIDGHELYVLTFPTAGITWVWDASTKEWHQRSSSGSTWLPTAYAALNNIHYVLDVNGNLYYIDPNNNTENGNTITRTITSPHFYALNNYIRTGRVELITNNAVGRGPTSGSMTLSWSKNYGNTYPGSVTFNFTGVPTQRFYQYRLGRGRDFVFNLSTTANPIIMDLILNLASPEEEAAAQQGGGIK